MADPIILSLDLATNTGWCVGAATADAIPRMNSVRLGKAGDHGSIGAGLDDWLWSFADLTKPTMLVVEAAIGQHLGQNAAKIALGLLMVCEVFAFRREIPITQCASSSVRARVIGSGRAQKPEVMAWCKSQGWNPPDNDASDAAALWELARRVTLGKASYK